MFCVAERPTSPLLWLAVPFLFSAAVLGLMGSAGLLTAAWTTVPLSPVVTGAGVAVAAATSGSVRWKRTWQRTWFRWAYLAAVLAVGVLVGAVEIPALVTTVVGVPVLLGLVFQCLVQNDENRRTADCR
ncbi:hypothetical protein [Lentzea jiangxiensis]|uniref:Uncharacterized protein n=1 Tax=Lentzea jiangxiensis TaxID=641025 RepID=A0A1H0FHF5_9PSEU|nr:hypothetical protein [Lentzea jiangxiensis]SDN94103.1 hypothetical protein SAMN05421507_101784 [Lentzea jiangxiensis]